MFAPVPLRSFCAVVLSGAVAACGGGGGGGSTSVPRGGSTPTPVPTSTAGTEAAYQCPSSDSASVARASGATREVRRHSGSGRRAAAAAPDTLLAVTYGAQAAAASRSVLEARERSTGGRISAELTFAHIGLTTHVLAVPAAQAPAIAKALRDSSDVRSVAVTGARRYPSTVSTPYFPNDPYFDGFLGSSAPLYETASIPGQWDAHITKLEYAFGYSQPNNGSGITNAAALGSSSVKIAVIDSGEDTTHPELQSKVVYQKCFITDEIGHQSISSFETDPVGHGTDVAGIAAADTNNDFGFTGAGGNTVIEGYRVYPAPVDSCANPASTDTQCGADPVDIASAIEDALDQHANVINLSLGGGGCQNGVDDDQTEGNAVEDAIAAGTIVVAAAGNDATDGSDTQGLEAPACDSGVIAAGASALADGEPNGDGNQNGSSRNPSEYVASYSDYGSPGAAVKSSSAWGIVAPGGDPNTDSDADDLHWVENIWTSTPYMANASDTSFEGECTDDDSDVLTTPPVDCRTFIAGTSMASPRVAGAAALILAVNPSYQSPSKMKSLLCTSADDIGDPHEGCGRLNIYRAMAVVVGDPTPP